MIIGAQFYTIREFCRNTEAFSLSLKKVADMGYTAVQISGTCAYDPHWLKQELDKNGLTCVLTHIPAAKLADPAAVCRDHHIFDCKNIGLGHYSFEKDPLKDLYSDFIKAYKPITAQLRDNGCYFMYHNHDAEFRKLDGKPVLDQIAEDFSAEELGITLDTFWVQAGGADPAQYLEKLSGRVPCIHLKDYGYGRTMEVIGEGNINFDRVLEKAESAGTQYLLVEQDDCNGENPFDCLRRSYQYLHSLGFK